AAPSLHSRWKRRRFLASGCLLPISQNGYVPHEHPLRRAAQSESSRISRAEDISSCPASGPTIRPLGGDARIETSSPSRRICAPPLSCNTISPPPQHLPLLPLVFIHFEADTMFADRQFALIPRT